MPSYSGEVKSFIVAQEGVLEDGVEVTLTKPETSFDRGRGCVQILGAAVGHGGTQEVASFNKMDYFLCWRSATGCKNDDDWHRELQLSDTERVPSNQDAEDGV